VARILIVKDNKGARAFMELALISRGYEVMSASDGGEALALQNERPADVLVTELLGREGTETIADFRSNFPDIKIIVTYAGPGAAPGTGRRGPARGMGADYFLLKPFTLRDLLSSIALLAGA